VQEGAVLHIQWAPLNHPWQQAAQGWRIGFLMCQRQAGPWSHYPDAIFAESLRIAFRKPVT
jgi:hypothetical protein